MARSPTPAEIDALAVFAAQLDGIKQRFIDVDRQDERFALYGAETPPPQVSISIDEWGALFGAVKVRLRLAAGQTPLPRFNDTPAALRATVLDCVDALDQLQALLGDALSGRAAAKRQHAQLSAVPVSTPPPRRHAPAAVAND